MKPSSAQENGGFAPYSVEKLRAVIWRATSESTDPKNRTKIRGHVTARGTTIDTISPFGRQSVVYIVRRSYIAQVCIPVVESEKRPLTGFDPSLVC